ncbi:threonine synthase, partial [Nitrosomonadales bacterium]|nr:threonine synthase [Nitrosomonadales bacterium]
SKASNFERFIFDLLDRDSSTLNGYWDQIDNGGSFQLDKKNVDLISVFGFISSSSKHDNRIKLIKQFYDEYDVIIDTHTADGVKASLDHLSKDTPMLVLETALPTKFERTVLEAIGKKPPRPESLINLEKIDQIFEIFENETSLVKDFILAKR